MAILALLPFILVAKLAVARELTQDKDRCLLGLYLIVNACLTIYSQGPKLIGVYVCECKTNALSHLPSFR